MTCLDSSWVCVQVAGQHEAREHGEAQHKEVPGGVQVHTLEVGQAHGRYHACASENKM